MTHIKKHHAHNEGHHHFVTRQKNGHKFTSLFCDSKTHLHSGKPIRTKNGVREILYSKDGVKIIDPQPHTNHQGHSHKISGKKAVAHKAEDHGITSQPKRKRKKISRQGEAGHIINKARRRAASNEPTKPVATDENQPAQTPNATSANTPTPTQPISNLAQYIAANQNKVTPYFLDEKGQEVQNSQTGLGIVKDETTGKYVALDDGLQSIPLETTDPTKLTDNDKKAIAAALQAGKLRMGKFVEAQAPAPQEPSTNAPVTPNATPAVAPTGAGAVQEQPLAPIGGETKISPNGDATQTVPVTPTEPVVPAQQPTTGTPPQAK